MKTVCLLCQRSSPDRNLFCQEIYCPAEMSPQIFEFGDQLGDIKIVRSIIVSRSATLYEARYNRNAVLVKVAHPGEEHTRRLKDEVALFKELGSHARSAHLFPQLMPPYATTSVDKDAYGRVVHNGQLLYYCVFKRAPGEPLRDILIKSPQLWIYHIGWLMTSLARVVATLQSLGRLHCAISPDVVLVSFSEGERPKLICFDLGLACLAPELGTCWYHDAVAPSYTAPELLGSPPTASYATDVYGLGLVLHELLLGRPAFPYTLSNDQDVYQAVREQRGLTMDRFEDVSGVAAIAVKATQPKPNKRYASAAEFAEALVKLFPEEKQSLPQRLGDWLRALRRSPRVALVMIGVLVAITLLVTVGVNLLS